MFFWKCITWQAWKRPIEIPSIYKEYNLSQKSLATLRRKPFPASPLSMLLQWCRLFFRYFFEPAKQHWVGGMGEKEATVQCYCLRLQVLGCPSSHSYTRIHRCLVTPALTDWGDYPGAWVTLALSEVLDYPGAWLPQLSLIHQNTQVLGCPSSHWLRRQSRFFGCSSSHLQGRLPRFLSYPSCYSKGN